MMKEKTDIKSISHSLIKFSLPLILSGIMQQLYSWIDAIIVGNYEGDIALGAVGSTATISNFFISAITGFTIGLSILFAHKFGSGEISVISQILSSFTILVGLIFAVFSVGGFIFTPALLKLMDTTPEVIYLAEDYLRIIFAGIPFLAVFNIYSAALRGIGDSRTPFLAVLISSVCNILLDLIFIILLGFGVKGAAAATVVSQALMTIFIVIYGRKKHSILSMNRKAFSRTSISKGISYGTPPMIQSSLTALGNLILQNFMNGFGTETVIAITTAYRIDSIILLPIINFGSGISTIVAQSYGAGDNKKAKKTFSVGIVLMTAIALILTVLIVFFGKHLIALFGADGSAVDIGQRFFLRIASFYIVYGLATAARGYIEGKGYMLYSGIAGLAALVVRIIASYAMADIFGNMVIAYAEAFSWGVLLILYFAKIIRRR